MENVSPMQGHPTECLELDHERLDRILLEGKVEATAGRYTQAAERFEAFAAGLSRHIDAEEGVLFPALLQMEPRSRGPITVMHAEHQDLRDLLRAIASDLAAASPEWRSRVRELEEILIAHNTKEERILYLMADDAARKARKEADLGSQLRAALRVAPSDRGAATGPPSVR